MAEQKKRWRPSLGEYRALEREIAELKEQLRLSGNVEELIMENKGLRNTISDLKQSTIPISDYKRLKEKNMTLEKSNRMMEKGQKMFADDIESLQERCRLLEDENERLMARKFWDRVFNR